MDIMTPASRKKKRVSLSEYPLGGGEKTTSPLWMFAVKVDHPVTNGEYGTVRNRAVIPVYNNHDSDN